jgi:hypothetical protein
MRQSFLFARPCNLFILCYSLLPAVTFRIISFNVLIELGRIDYQPCAHKYEFNCAHFFGDLLLRSKMTLNCSGFRVLVEEVSDINGET